MNNIKARLQQWDCDPKNIPGMIYSVYNDGEISFEKCCNGELLGQRTLHLREPGFGKEIDRNLFPRQTNSHGFIYCKDYETAYLTRELIKNNL